MRKVLPALFLGLIIGLLIRPAQPQQASGGEQIASVQPAKRTPESLELIEFRPDQKDPFYLNQQAATELTQLREQHATEQLSKIKKLFTELITNHPETAAGKEAQQILEKAELRVQPGYGIIPKNVFFSVVPITR